MDNSAFPNDIQRFKAATFLPQPQLRARNTQDIDNIEFLQTSAVEALFYFFSNQFEKISDGHINGLHTLFVAAKSDISALIAPVTILNSIKAIQSEKLTVNKNNLAGLIAECKTEDFAIRLVQAAVANNLTLISPFSGNRATCQESYEVENEMFFLRFTDGHRCFFLIQYVSSADGLYFPEENILITLAHVKDVHIKRFLKKLISTFPSAVNYATSMNRFLGVLASHSRPGHFYYDIWPVLLEVCQQKEIIDQIPHLIMRKDHDFYDIGQLFEGYKTLITEKNELDKILLNDNKWVIHLGTNRQLHLHRFYYEVSDKYWVNKAISSPTGIALAKVKQVEGCYPLVWIGVEGQKRSWLEQVEGYAYMLNQLAKKYPNLGVVIDGWTLPYTPSEASIKEAGKDLLVEGKILKRLNPVIKHVSVIGENSNTKIFVGNKIDFFICNFATGSIHVSKMLGKPGFCHLSGDLSSMSLQFGIQIHPNNRVYLLPKKYVADKHKIQTTYFKKLKTALLNVKNKFSKNQNTLKIAPGSLSYSIDKKVFYHFIEQRLDKVLDKNEPTKTNIFIEPAFGVHFSLRQHLKMAAQGNFIQIFQHQNFPKKIEDIAGFSNSYLARNIIYGVFGFGIHHKLNTEASYMIWLSDPLQRLRLHIGLFTKQAANNNQAPDLNHILTVGYKGLDNYYTRLVSGMEDVPFGQCSEDMLDTAIGNLTRHFIFIGIDEQQAQSFDRLCTLKDWDRSLFPDKLPNRLQAAIDEFSGNEQRLADALIQYDLRLYDAALAMVNKVKP